MIQLDSNIPIAIALLQKLLAHSNDPVVSECRKAFGLYISLNQTSGYLSYKIIRSVTLLLSNFKYRKFLSRCCLGRSGCPRRSMAKQQGDREGRTWVPGRRPAPAWSILTEVELIASSLSSALSRGRWSSRNGEDPLTRFDLWHAHRPLKLTGQ